MPKEGRAIINESTFVNFRQQNRIAFPFSLRYTFLVKKSFLFITFPHTYAHQQSVLCVSAFSYEKYWFHIWLDVYAFVTHTQIDFFSIIIFFGIFTMYNSVYTVHCTHPIYTRVLRQSEEDRKRAIQYQRGQWFSKWRILQNAIKIKHFIHIFFKTCLTLRQCTLR